MHPLTLGGFLAQGVAYQLIEHKIYNVFSSKNSNVATVKETLTDGNYFKKTVTFNAAPFFNVTYINGPGFFSAAISSWDLNSDKYDQKVYNYSIKGDFLQPFVNLKQAKKLGQVVPAFSKKRKGSAHSLVQFFDHFPKLD